MKNGAQGRNQPVRARHRHEDFQSKLLRVYGQISWRIPTVLFLRCSLQRATRTYPEIEFTNSNTDFEKLIREPEHTQCVSRIELHPNLEPNPNFGSRILFIPSSFSNVTPGPCAEVEFLGSPNTAWNTGNLKNWERRRDSGLESGSEWSGAVRRPLGTDILGLQLARETGNLKTWGGRVEARLKRFRRPGSGQPQIFSSAVFQISPKAVVEDWMPKRREPITVIRSTRLTSPSFTSNENRLW